jgi:Spy/CpxP family protein refolding chaperone
MKNIRNILALVVLLLVVMPLGMAQEPENYERPYSPPDISRFVTNLSDKQKAELKKIAAEGRTTIEGYRREMKELHESIMIYYRMAGDRSDDLFPLYCQRSALYAKIDQEKYRIKMKMDSILTPEQLEELHRNIELERRQRQLQQQMRHFIHP